MMLFLAMVSTVVTIVLQFFILFATGMSDVPNAKAPLGPLWIGVPISLLLWVCWYFGWHPSW